jgi:hypothetical protein
MSTRAEECGLCNHDHPSAHPCLVKGCECNDEEVSQDSKSGVNAFFGIWPGDETDEELLDALKRLG